MLPLERNRLRGYCQPSLSVCPAWFYRNQAANEHTSFQNLRLTCLNFFFIERDEELASVHPDGPIVSCVCTARYHWSNRETLIEWHLTERDSLPQSLVNSRGELAALRAVVAAVYVRTPPQESILSGNLSYRVTQIRSYQVMWFLPAFFYTIRPIAQPALPCIWSVFRDTFTFLIFRDP